MSDSQCFGLRIGPIETDPERSYCFLLVEATGGLLKTIRAPDALTGVAALQLMADRRFACEPVLSDAAEALGVPVEQPTPQAERARAEAALDLAPVAGLPATDPVDCRQVFLQGMGDYFRSKSRDRLEAGPVLSAQVRGQWKGNDRLVVFSLSRSTGRMVRGTLTDFASDRPQGMDMADFYVSALELPAFASEALGRAYALIDAPAIEIAGEPVTAEWLERYGPLLGAALRAVSSVPVTSQSWTEQVVSTVGLDVVVAVQFSN